MRADFNGIGVFRVDPTLSCERPVRRHFSQRYRDDPRPIKSVNSERPNADFNPTRLRTAAREISAGGWPPPNPSLQATQSRPCFQVRQASAHRLSAPELESLDPRSRRIL